MHHLSQRTSHSSGAPFLWIWIGFAIAALVSRFSHGSSVIRIYQEAAQHFLQGQPLYDASGFLYLPTSAALLTPIAWLSPEWAGVLIRSFNIALFALGVSSLGRWRPLRLSASSAYLGLCMILVIAWSAARHGQLTLGMSGLLMLGCVQLEERRHWRAGLCLALALALKPIALPLVLLAVALHPRALIPCMLGVLALASLPFALQTPEYVWQVYGEVPGMLARESERAAGPTLRYHLFGMLGTLGVHLQPGVEWLLRAFAAALTLLMALWLRARRGEPLLAVELYTLGVGYILLFSPGTERNTYALLAPCLAHMYWMASQRGRRLIALLVLLIFLAFLFSHSLGKAYPESILAMGKPLASLCLLGLFLAWSPEPQETHPAQIEGVR